MPETKVALDTLLEPAVKWIAVPLFPRPVASVRLLSNGKCRTSPEISGAFVGGDKTVSVAEELSSEPVAFEIVTIYVPASLSAKGLNVSARCVAPGTGTPFFFH